ncbi:hypothetical protein HN51_069685 [Arachis hypogaea]|uniref:Protein PHYTOCHROME KINASE SUBSTRATE n=1 Tax=Arachis hypogaea TaxID=3818 RepID=A0A444Z5D7_ARAHY|nr:protein PHYTOCHROME KINASE SUBSTRATE 1-like [Arachis ipaensis]XP_025654839.1 protein PHYTOCHROME KINASE SUBSTRATE 1-like [Arachis hypogaea]QHO12022.1 Protein PHYTOCHROME KINASE SUBSTRATE [Arachis hypogaea]RYR09234.1 hypothetical protein Ahy_B05g077402 [Arachis hypogaea]
MVIIASTTANSNMHNLQNFDSNQNNNHHLRNASISSYLNTNEQQQPTFVDSSSQNFNSRKEGEPLPFLQHGIMKEEDCEIGVFEAEKYFNGAEGGEVLMSQRRKNQYHHHYYDQKKDEQKSTETGKFNNRSSNKFGTPSSVPSESSWNSQSALLQSSLKESSRLKNNKVQRNKASFLANLGCKCYCSDKDSVAISNNTSSAKKNLNPVLDTNNHHHRDSVKETNPHAEAEISLDNNKEKLLNRENALLALKKIQLQEKAEKSRKSLEVFGSPILNHCTSKSLSFDKRLVMHSSWDDDDADAVVLPKIEETDLAKRENGNYNDDDCESDASSDLFEIDSLTGKANNPFLVRPIRTSCEVISFCASPVTTCYAPSEASIEWSVVTASAFEYSAMSDCEDQRSVATLRSPARPQPKAGKEVYKRRPGMLLGCKSQKAVGVASETVKASEKLSPNSQFSRKFDNINQVARFQAETKQGKPPMQQRSHPPHASQLLCI